MAYYYVKSGGTATGDLGRYASQQSGSFASLGSGNYYGSLAAAYAATTVPTHGDFICLSDAHAYSSASILTLTAPVSPGAGLVITSVSDSNCNVASVAGSYQENVTGGSSDIFLNSTNSGFIGIYGVWFQADDDLQVVSASGGNITCVNCVFVLTGTADALFWGRNDGSQIKIINCTVESYDSSFQLDGGTYYEIRGGSITITTGSSPRALMNNPALAGGSFGFVEGANLTGLDTLVGGNAGGTTHDHFRAKFVRCRLPASMNFIESGGTMEKGDILEVYNCADDSSAEYQYYYRDGQCIAEDDTAFYRSNAYAYPDSGQKISIKVSTDSLASPSYPFAFRLPTLYANLASTSSDLIKFHILSSSSLTDLDIWLEMIYPDGTNIHVPNIVRSVSNPFAPFRSGSALTTNTETWTGRTTENRYEISLDTSSDPGAKCVPIINCYVTKPSISLYICPTPEAS